MIYIRLKLAEVLSIISSHHENKKKPVPFREVPIIPTQNVIQAGWYNATKTSQQVRQESM